MPEPQHRFHDPVRQAKLEDAIHRGLIIKNIHNDGVPEYKITMLGQAQWVAEKFFTDPQNGFAR